MSLPAAPYANDTKAKGWRFELDHERIRQSDTWTLAPSEIKPWLLMLWMTAWEQVPCGSLPSNDELIAARIGMPLKSFTKHRASLMRGWWAADDGRLYHATIAERVLDLIEYRRKEAERRKGNRAKPPGVPPMSHGTPAGQQQDDTRAPDTSTGTSTGTITPLTSLRSEGEAPPTAGQACMAMKSAGMAGVNPSNPKLTALLQAGITLPELADAAKHAVENGKPFAYALATAEGRRRDAYTPALPSGKAPNKQEAIEDRNRAVAAEWANGATNASH